MILFLPNDSQLSFINFYSSLIDRVQEKNNQCEYDHQNWTRHN